MKQLLFPIILRMGDASNVKSVPKNIVHGLASQGLPLANINAIIRQYENCYYLTVMTDFCRSCGTHVTRKTTTQTCSDRCYKHIFRNKEGAVDKMIDDAKKRLEAIESMAKKGDHKELKDFPWHKLSNGWKYALYD